MFPQAIERIGGGRGRGSDLLQESMGFLEHIHMEQTYGVPDVDTGAQDKVSLFV